MITQSLLTTERALQLYSVEVEHWWDGSGEGDQLLSAREWLESRFDQLDPEQAQRLGRLDDQVIARAIPFNAGGSWDVDMLMKTAKIAARHTASASTTA